MTDEMKLGTYDFYAIKDDKMVRENDTLADPMNFEFQTPNDYTQFIFKCMDHCYVVGENVLGDELADELRKWEVIVDVGTYDWKVYK